MTLEPLLEKKYFADFEYESVVNEPCLNYSLFQEDIKDIQLKQLDVFNYLENSLPMNNGSSFKNHVHFQFAYQTPVQRWYPYREGYSTKLVNSFLTELNIKGNVFDPFSGSGTTLLASRRNNLDSFGIDVNPISVLVAQVENEKYAKNDIEDLKSEILKFKYVNKSNEIFQTTFNLADKVFNPNILQSLLQLKYYIKEIRNHKIHNIFFVTWLSIIESVSNIKKEGNGIKYKNRKRTPKGYINIDKEKWENEVFPADKFRFVRNAISKHLDIILNDIEYQYGAIQNKPTILKGSCLEFEKMFSEEIQFTFYSPPYCNCFDYFEIHKVELWLGDFVNDKEEFRLLRNTGFRSNTNSLNQKPIIYKNAKIEELISLFDTDKLWNTQIPKVVNGYFDDTHTLLKKIYHQTIKGGFVGIVVGNSAYSGVIIPSDVLVANIAKEIGFKVKNIFVTRHLTTSSQQKKDLVFLKNYLRESIVLLEK
jgi:DNA modification methylase